MNAKKPSGYSVPEGFFLGVSGFYPAKLTDARKDQIITQENESNADQDQSQEGIGDPIVANDLTDFNPGTSGHHFEYVHAKYNDGKAPNLQEAAD